MYIYVQCIYIYRDRVIIIYIYIIFVRVCERWFEELTLCNKAPTMQFRFDMEQEAENGRNEPHY